MIVRPSRPLHSQPRSFSRSRRAALVAASVACVLLGTSFLRCQRSGQQRINRIGTGCCVGGGRNHAVQRETRAVTQAISLPNHRLERPRHARKMARALFDANPTRSWVMTEPG